MRALSIIGMALTLGPALAVGAAPATAQESDSAVTDKLARLESERGHELADIRADLRHGLAVAARASAPAGRDARQLKVRARQYDRMALIEHRFAERRAAALGYELGRPPKPAFVGPNDVEQKLILLEAERYREVSRAFAEFDRDLRRVHEEDLRSGEPEKYSMQHVQLRARLGERLVTIERRYAEKRAGILDRSN